MKATSTSTRHRAQKIVGRYDSANDKTKDEITKLSVFFEAQFGMTMSEAVTG